MKQITILSLSLLLLNGCIQHYDRNKYTEWYNQKETQDAKNHGRKPKLIKEDDAPINSLIKSIDTK